ncbi:UDP-N-acetylglucosamine-N-acetylmuramylpentapeptide N-acetylglucosamine transferase [Microbacteriaceae bacterium MWH-Ta3]|nr:UDP-N-acetylglucosamine-N-acetylmuramylpentapeptide N-acetylglucosamine transferase [Microbacteriaceae bacterium MWH-Ta3]
MTTFLLAGGGTAGHVNPLLATADELTRRGEAQIVVLGTREGLESRLVPERGYELVTIAKLPFPRRPSLGALAFPFRFAAAVAQIVGLIRRRSIRAVVGFGGYAAAPAYVAAWLARIPLIFHEANAHPGIANVIGARLTRHRATAFRNTPISGATFVGMPLRAEIATMDAAATRSEAKAHFGIPDSARVLLVTGGSTGAARINQTIRETAAEIVAAGWHIVHTVGESRDFVDPQIPGYHPMVYCNRMDLALAAAEFAVSRSGAATMSELAALSIPAAFIPYPVGNGEQVKNAHDLVSTGGAMLCLDRDFTPEWVRAQLLPVMTSANQRADMSHKAGLAGVRDGAARFVDFVLRAIEPQRA